MPLHIFRRNKKTSSINPSLLKDVERYIDENYIDEQYVTQRKSTREGTKKSKRYGLSKKTAFNALYDEEASSPKIDEHHLKYKTTSRRCARANRADTLSASVPIGAAYESSLEDTLCLGNALPLEDALDEGRPLNEALNDLDEPFSRMLFRLIQTKNMDEVDVYKRANIDRKHFSKIRSNDDYRPGKQTVIALAIALKLSLEETEAFLKRAGFALSHAVKFDVIIEYFIINEKYDIFEINEVLFQYDQPLLGA